MAIDVLSNQKSNQNSEKKQVEFDVLLLIDGDKIQVGAPYIKDMKVKAEVIGDIKGEKIEVMRFKAKKRVKIHTGHRQKYTQVKITSIG